MVAIANEPLRGRRTFPEEASRERGFMLGGQKFDELSQFFFPRI